MLINLGLKLDAVRREVLNLLGAGNTAPPAGPATALAGPDVFLDLARRCLTALERIRTVDESFAADRSEAIRGADYDCAAELRDRAEALRVRLSRLNEAFSSLQVLVEQLEQIDRDFPPDEPQP